PGYRLLGPGHLYMQYPGPNENLTSDGVARGVPPWRLAFGVWRVSVPAMGRDRVLAIRCGRNTLAEPKVS
ncbi:MAG: hypothetical protein WBZ19_04180, partial [Chthoniobacterales bacterium]